MSYILIHVSNHKGIQFRTVSDPKVPEELEGPGELAFTIHPIDIRVIPPEVTDGEATTAKSD